VTLNGASLTILGDDDPTRALVIPRELRREGDQYELHVIDELEPFSAWRWVAGPLGDGPFPAELPDPLAEPDLAWAGGMPVARFDRSGGWNEIALHLQWQPPDYGPRPAGLQWKDWSARAWPGWVGDAPPGELGFPDLPSIPGWNPEWEIASSVVGELRVARPRGEPGMRVGVSQRAVLSSP
jgi:hypothetical protein